MFTLIIDNFGLHAMHLSFFTSVCILPDSDDSSISTVSLLLLFVNKLTLWKNLKNESN